MKLDLFFPFEPTNGQKHLIEKFEKFVDTDNKKKTFLIRGHAGTGKTHSITAITKYFKSQKTSFRLLAPTGRAAKVMTRFTRYPAFTIHSHIFKYSFEETEDKFGSLILKENKSQNTCFIVDEASMIGASGYSQGLLGNLIKFVFTHENNTLILVGDDTQLPPIHQQKSYGLDASFLEQAFSLNIFETHLDDVTRQTRDSGILYNANQLRKRIEKEDYRMIFYTKSFNDIFMISHKKVEEGLHYSFNKYEAQNVILLTRSNWAAVQYNQFIRRTILDFENEIEVNDLLMVTKNNYYYQLDRSQGRFIANGDFFKVRKIFHEEEIYGFRFAMAELSFLEDDINDENVFEAKIILDSLHEIEKKDVPKIYVQLRKAIENEYIVNGLNPFEIQREMKQNSYLNALQVKFSYALTTHKAQGGQWKVVFLDPGKIREDEPNDLYSRWLYTGITRAYQELYLINFPNTFFLNKE